MGLQLSFRGAQWAEAREEVRGSAGLLQCPDRRKAAAVLGQGMGDMREGFVNLPTRLRESESKRAIKRAF